MSWYNYLFDRFQDVSDALNDFTNDVLGFSLSAAESVERISDNQVKVVTAQYEFLVDLAEIPADLATELAGLATDAATSPFSDFFSNLTTAGKWTLGIGGAILALYIYSHYGSQTAGYQSGNRSDHHAFKFDGRTDSKFDGKSNLGYNQDLTLSTSDLAKLLP